MRPTKYRSCAPQNIGMVEVAGTGSSHNLFQYPFQAVILAQGATIFTPLC